MKAQSVSKLVQMFIYNLEHSHRRKYTTDTHLRYNTELNLLISVVAMDTEKTVVFMSEGDQTVQQFAQLMWDKYYK